jgi:CBS domain-containing protein
MWTSASMDLRIRPGCGPECVHSTDAKRRLAFYGRVMDVPAPIGSYLTPSFEHARVRDAMRPAVLTCDPATALVTVAQRMAGEHIHALVVLRETVADGAPGRRPWAVLTDRDILRCAPRIDELTAGDAASGEVLEAHPDDRLADVAERMLDHAVSHAVVVNPDTGRPIGVLSTLDIAGILAWGRG